ncbi:polysaccharide biosynthesis protein [Clostridium tunisiense]|uniref:polysaccharide biosynthesis protein n=1 Tax=Clostridium tunisiense TaxID=219748 RepID=UPI0002E8A475|nr:nucleoside-diphosphate sugar epimerase/dehydratase [Clostridium tunisiense]
MVKGKKMVTLALVDVIIIVCSYVLSYFVRYFNTEEFSHIVNLKDTLPWIILTYLGCFYLFRLYESLWSFAGTEEFLMGVIGCIAATTTVLGLQTLVIHSQLPRMIMALSGIFILIFSLGFRVSFRVARRTVIYLQGNNKGTFKRVMIVGAGEGARTVIGEMKKNPQHKYQPVVLIDDAPSKKNTSISGVKVLGSRQDIEVLAKKYSVDLILFAIPSACEEVKKEIIKICSNTKLEVKTLPGVKELIGTGLTLKQIRDVDVKDLLGREQIKLDHEGISEYLKGKRVLVTGGGGSIGSELCRQIAQFKPEELMILDIYENNAYDLQMELERKYPSLKLKVFIASVRDRKRLESIFQEHKPEVVFHAAAHKHVPLMEYNPTEAIKNNVFGTLNVAECADKYNVNKFVLISTDKAVNPTNIMGATKRMCEMIIQAQNKISNTEYVAVRFGNVLGSNGSVIPLFKKQIAEGGPLTVTNKNITRFFMLIPEAAQLVLQAGAYAKGGEIFVLDMGKPVRIYDLALDLIKLSGLEPHKDIKIEVTGLRPGEKLYEELLMAEEGLEKTGHDKIFVGQPTFSDMEELKSQFEELKIIINSEAQWKVADKVEKIVPTYVRKTEELVAAANVG